MFERLLQNHLPSCTPIKFALNTGLVCNLLILRARQSSVARSIVPKKSFRSLSCLKNRLPIDRFALIFQLCSEILYLGASMFMLLYPAILLPYLNVHATFATRTSFDCDFTGEERLQCRFCCQQEPTAGCSIITTWGQQRPLNFSWKRVGL